MKYFLIVVLIVLGYLAFTQVSKVSKGSSQELFDKYPYPTSGKLSSDGIRPALTAKDAEAMKKLATPGAQADVGAFMSAYTAAVGGVTLGDLQLFTTGDPDQGPENLVVEATDANGNMVFEGVLQVSNPNDNLLYQIVGASVK